MRILAGGTSSVSAAAGARSSMSPAAPRQDLSSPAADRPASPPAFTPPVSESTRRVRCGGSRCPASWVPRLRQPWPGMTRASGTTRRYLDTYWSRWPDSGCMATGRRHATDTGASTAAATTRSRSRASGRARRGRVGAGEAPRVVEAAAIGVPDALKGESIWCFVVPPYDVSIDEDDLLVLRRHPAREGIHSASHHRRDGPHRGRGTARSCAGRSGLSSQARARATSARSTIPARSPRFNLQWSQPHICWKGDEMGVERVPTEGGASFSAAVVVTGPGRWVHVSGQIEPRPSLSRGGGGVLRADRCDAGTAGRIAE